MQHMYIIPIRTLHTKFFFVRYMFMPCTCLWQWPTRKLSYFGHCAHFPFLYLCLFLFVMYLLVEKLFVNSAKNNKLNLTKPSSGPEQQLKAAIFIWLFSFLFILCRFAEQVSLESNFENEATCDWASNFNLESIKELQDGWTSKIDSK